MSNYEVAVLVVVAVIILVIGAWSLSKKDVILGVVQPVKPKVISTEAMEALSHMGAAVNQTLKEPEEPNLPQAKTVPRK